MRCSKANKLISQYIDGELSPQKRKFLEAHMNECKKCSREFDEIRKLHTRLVSSEKFSAPYGFSSGTMARVNETAGRRDFNFTKSIIFRPAVLAASLSIAIALFVGNITGRVLIGNLTEDRENSINTVFAMDSFNAFPRYSIGQAYLAMMAGDEHGK